MKIYIAGPYTKGDTAMKVRASIFAQNYLEWTLGHMAYNPLLSHFQHMVIPHDIEFWYKKDIEWLLECDAVLRLEGESVGADREVEIARTHGMTIYTSVFEIPKCEPGTARRDTSARAELEIMQSERGSEA